MPKPLTWQSLVQYQEFEEINGERKRISAPELGNLALLFMHKLFACFQVELGPVLVTIWQPPDEELLELEEEELEDEDELDEELEELDEEVDVLEQISFTASIAS